MVSMAHKIAALELSFALVTPITSIGISNITDRPQVSVSSAVALHGGSRMATTKIHQRASRQCVLRFFGVCMRYR